MGICSYEKCMTCHCKNCLTGQIARENGREAYDDFLKEMDKATVAEDVEDNIWQQ